MNIIEKWTIIFEEYLTNGSVERRCPNCGNDTLDIRTVELEGRILLNASCSSCGAHQEVTQVKSDNI